MKFLKDFFKTLNKKKVRYCVLRNYDELPRTIGGSDLDLLIFNKSIGLFFNTFENFKNENNLFLCSFIPDQYSSKLCIMDSKGGVQIDVFKKSVFFGGKEIVPSNILFENTEVYNGIRVLRKDFSVLLSFLKEILNNKTCKEKYKEQLKSHFSECKIPPEYLTQFSGDFYKYLNENLSTLDDKDCLTLYGLAKRDFKKHIFLGFSHKLKRFFKNPGYVIAVLGTDGSGKSTIIEGITPALNDAFHNSVYYEHLRPNKFPSLAALFENEDESAGPVTNPHGSTSSGFWGSLVRWSYYMLDYTVGFFLKIWPKKAIRSCVWIFDRYYYDYLIDPKRSRIKLPKWLLKFGQYIIPEPDIILCLGTDPRTIHNRKQELSFGEVECQVAMLQDFCDEHPRAKWIDTGKDIENSANDAMEYIIEVMAKRFEHVDLAE